MTRSIRLACVAAVLVLSTSADRAAAEEPFRNLTFEKACETAKAEGKVVMIDFYTTWCGPCKKLDRTTWKNNKVRAWLKAKTVAIKVDAERQRKLSARYQVKAYPTILFLKPDGTTIDRLVGYKPPAAFLKAAKAGLSGKDSLTRAREALAGHETDPMKRMQYADILAREGKTAEALKEYLWCWDHGEEHGLGFGGVRVSFLLGRIARLGAEHPPALKALERRSREARRKILSAPPRKKKPAGIFAWLRSDSYEPYVRAAQDLCALNRRLKREEETLKLYDHLKQKGEGYQELRHQLGREVFDLLLEARRYDDIVQDCDDAMERIEFLERMFKDLRKRFGDSEPALLADEKREVVTEGAKYYEALLGAGRTKKAAKVANRLIRFESTGRTFATLIEHAVRAGDRETAEALARRGLSEVPEKERPLVTEARAKIPGQA